MIEAYTKAGAKVGPLTKAQFAAWIELAKKTAWPEFAAKSADAKVLLDLITTAK